MVTHTNKKFKIFFNVSKNGKKKETDLWFFLFRLLETPRVSGMPIEQLLKDLKAADEDRALIKGNNNTKSKIYIYIKITKFQKFEKLL